MLGFFLTEPTNPFRQGSKNIMTATVHNSRLYLIFLLGTLSAFGPFITDLYLPALPQITEAFHTYPSFTQASLMSAMIGMGVGQFIVGPMSDKYGRRRPLMICLTLYALTSLALVFASNIHVLIALRSLQGFFAAGGVVMSRAVATDLYRGDELRRFFALLMTVHGIAPILSPIAGSALLSFTDWHGIFVVLTLLGVGVIAFAAPFKESLAPERRYQGSLVSTFQSYFVLFENRPFILFVLLQALTFGGMFAYISASPFLFQVHYGLEPLAFSLCFGANGLAVMMGANISTRLPALKALKIGVRGFGLATILIAVVLYTEQNVFCFEAALFVMQVFVGFTMPSASTLAMDAERERAGRASALLGFCPFLLGAIVSPIVGMGIMTISTALVMLTMGLLVQSVYARLPAKSS